MKNTKKILSIMLLLSMFLTFLLPLTVSAEESYTLSGTWIFNENIKASASSVNSYLNFTSHTCSSGYDIEYLGSTYNQIRYMDDELGNVLVYDSSGWKSLEYRTVDFGEAPQKVEKDFYLWFISVAKKFGVKPSSVIADLNKDSKFNANNYPHIADDYGLEVIQIAESDNGELYIYVYQPSDATKNLEAKYINMSLQDISKRNLTYDLYSLTLVNSYGVFDKYVVNDFKVSSDPDRFYNIASIYRAYDSSIDSTSEAIDSKQYVAFEVAQSWYAYYYNGQLQYEMETMDVVEIEYHATGSVRYANGLKFGQLYIDSCDSHYVAFSIENYDVEKIYDADIVYTIGTYSWAETYTPYHYSEELASTQVYKKTLSHLETASNDGSGLFGKKYTWYRIQDVNTFINEAQNDANESFSEDELAALRSSDFVFRFAETDYYMTPTSTSSFGSFSKTENVGILRLHFLSEGKYYNLGVVSDLVGTDEKPDLDVSGSDNFQNNLEELMELINSIFDFLDELYSIVLIIILVLGFVLFARFAKPIFTPIKQGFGEIFSIILAIILTPFELIASLFRNKRR